MSLYAKSSDDMPACECTSFADYTWNGWAIPEFTLDQVRESVFAMLAENPHYTEYGYDEKQDTVYVCEPYMDPDTARVEYIGYLNADGVKVYAVGGGEWTWEKHECCDHVEYESYCRCCGAENAHN